MTALSIRPATCDDAAAICEIYNHYILDSIISFEEVPLAPDDIATRIARTQSQALPWLVMTQDGQLLGYAYASRWRERSAYRYTLESSIYLAPSATGKGLGKQLYSALLQALRELTQPPIHSVVGGVAQPNAASNALHQALGFEKTATFREVGRKFDRWIDVSYWQLSLQTGRHGDSQAGSDTVASNGR